MIIRDSVHSGRSGWREQDREIGRLLYARDRARLVAERTAPRSGPPGRVSTFKHVAL